MCISVWAWNANCYIICAGYVREQLTGQSNNSAKHKQTDARIFNKHIVMHIHGQYELDERPSFSIFYVYILSGLFIFFLYVGY